MQHDIISNMNETIVSHDMQQVTDLRNIPCLIIISDINSTEYFPLQKGINVVGRSNADIVIDDPEMSRNHFQIDYTDNNIFIEDLNSTNGTFINNIKLKKKTILRNTYTVHAGRSSFKLEFKSQPELEFEEKILIDATLDKLTGVMNKKYFLEEAPQIVEKAISQNSNLAFLLFDIDHFKLVNDTYGHLAGDYVLKEFAQIISKQKRKSDIFARFGGEEFVLIFEGKDVTIELIRKFAERIRYLVEYYNFSYEKQPIPLTVSIGACFRTTDKISELDDMLAEADTALYHCKKTGRNKVHVTPQPNP